MKKLLFLFLLASFSSIFYCQENSKNKDGFVTEVYANGKPKSKIYFKGGKPFGIAQMFDQKGYLSEVGYWHNDRWVGNYYLYYPNGQIMHKFNFSTDGKRTGIQTYYFTNGIIKAVALFIEGKADGASYHFDSLGNFTLKNKETYDSISKKSITVKTIESFPADSIIIDYAKNENLNVFRITNLQKAETEAKVNTEKLNAEKQKNFFYLLFSIVFGISLIAIIYSYVQLRKNKLKVEIQSKVIEEKNKDILDSIRYAKRIQTSLLPTDKFINRILSEKDKKPSS